MSTVHPTGEHEFEAAHGLPEPLPARERLLWQGSPDWKPLAVHVFHVRKLAWYFAALLAVQALFSQADGLAPMAILKSTLGFTLLAGMALGLMAFMAWLSARTTVYTLTDRRLVMRVGIVLTLTFNLPLRRIAAAHTRERRDGTQDIALELAGDDKIAYFHLWPHARPWHLARPQPMLRVLPARAGVAALLQTAWVAQAQGTALSVPVRPADAQAADADATPGHLQHA